MKFSTKSFVLIFLFAMSGIRTSAQQTATASGNASGTILTALTLNKTNNLNFGIISAGSTAGTVVLTPSGSRSVTGGCQLTAGSPGTVTAAAFSITGTSTTTYSISLPSASTIITGSGAPMSVDTYVSTPSGGGSFSGTAVTIYVGGTLHVASNQGTGLYSLAGGLTISVNYN